MPRIQNWGNHLWDVAENGCWIWNGTLTKHGYGQFKRNTKAHRKALSLVLERDLTPEEKVLHSCDNPPCVNPEHLRLGTQAENMQDMDSRERRFSDNLTHCINGHARTPENTYKRGKRGLRCKICLNISITKYRKKLKTK